MNTYPVIYIPKDLKVIDRSDPYEDISKPIYNPPQKPKMPFKLWEEEMAKEARRNIPVGIWFLRILLGIPILVFLGGFFLIWPLFAFDEVEAKFIIMIINTFALLILFAIIYYTDDVRTIKENYEKEIAEYENDLSAYKIEYENELAFYKRIRLNIMNYKRTDSYLKKTLNSYRKQLFDQFIDKIEKPTLVIENKTQGISENYFLRYLNIYFKGFIYTNLSIEHEYLDTHQSKDQVYIPDFIFIKEGLPIIDIEIDEPYSAHNGKPIHYITSDDIRDQFFEDKKWIIIRFAEEQVVKEPHKCCFVIAETIFSYSKDSTFIDKFDSYDFPEEVERWRLSDSIMLAHKRYRNEYLPHNMQHK